MNTKTLQGALLLAALVPGAARGGNVGLGVDGGGSFPIVQEDNGNGSVFGVRVPVNLAPLITLEPYWAKTNGGDKTQDAFGVSYTRSGIDNDNFGANVLFTFGTGLRYFPYAGIGSNHMTRDGMDERKTGYDFGMGLGFKLPLANLSGDVRAGVNMVVSPASTESSRKWGEITVGVAYGIYKLPVP